MPIDHANPRNPTRRYALSLPPPDVIAALGWGDLDDRAGEYRQLVERERKGRVLLDAAIGARGAAEDKDRRAAAKALRAGKPDPGSPAAAKADKALEQARRDLAVIVQAVSDCEAEMVEDIAQRRPALATNIEDAREQARAAITPAVEALTEAVDTLADLAAAQRWLTSFPSPQGFKRPNVMLPGLEDRGGEPYLATAALAALAALAEPPPPPMPPPEPARLPEQVAA